MTTNGARHRRHKFDDRLMRQTYRAINNPAPEYLRSHLLLLGKPIIVSVNENVGVNQSVHERTDPLYSNLDPGALQAVPVPDAFVAVR